MDSDNTLAIFLLLGLPAIVMIGIWAYMRGAAPRREQQDEEQPDGTYDGGVLRSG